MKEHTILDVYNSLSSGKKILTVVDSRLNSVSYDLADLDDQSSRAAAVLSAYGCSKGDRVLISERDTLTIWSFFWGALKLGAVPCVLFPGLGLSGLEVRLKAAEVCFWITDIHLSKFVDRIHFPDLPVIIYLVCRALKTVVARQDGHQPHHFVDMRDIFRGWNVIAVPLHLPGNQTGCANQAMPRSGGDRPSPAPPSVQSAA